MKILIIPLASLMLIALSAYADPPGECIDGVMTDSAGNTSSSCFVTRSGKTIRLFHTSAYRSNLIQIDADKRVTCEDDAIMRITPDDMTCISRRDIALGQTRPDRIIRIHDLPEANSSIRILAGGHWRSN